MTTELTDTAMSKSYDVIVWYYKGQNKTKYEGKILADSQEEAMDLAEQKYPTFFSVEVKPWVDTKTF